MKYPNLETTPIKETIFSVSYEEIIDKNCFDKFLELSLIKDKFEIKPSIDRQLKIDGEKVDVSTSKNGFHLKNDNEILQIRRGSFSLHYINGYKKFDSLLNSFIEYWSNFDKVTKDDLTTTNFSVRYINVIETDDENQATHLVQLYPKQSNDRDIINFQNSIQFSYKKYSDYIVNAVSTKLDKNGILLDITVKGNSKNNVNQNINLKSTFKPLQQIKNMAFFDSITARALLKYIEETR